MSSLIDVLDYINQNKLSEQRFKPTTLIRIVFLCDWKSSIERSKTITQVKWSIKEFEPVLDNNSIPQLIEFVQRSTKPVNQKRHFLKKQDKSIIDSVLKSIASKNETQISRLVYSTYPAFLTDDEEEADLPALAKNYKENFPSSNQVKNSLE